MEDTLTLRDYDLRMNQIHVHLDLSKELPWFLPIRTNCSRFF